MAALAYPYGRILTGSARRRERPSGREHGHLRLVTGPECPHDARQRPSRPASHPARIRRALPGVATVAALVGVWVGAGALASAGTGSHLVHLEGTRRVAGGYAYVVRPGDTLWSIATRLEPSGDPRPLVDQLAGELHGAGLQPGEVLVVP